MDKTENFKPYHITFGKYKGEHYDKVCDDHEYMSFLKSIENKGKSLEFLIKYYDKKCAKPI